MKVKIE